MAPQSPHEGLPDPLPIRTRGPLSAKVRVPGSRSQTNRALLVAALASGESLLRGATESDDTAAMREGLRALGVSIRTEPEGWRVHGTGGRLTAPESPLDVRMSGTTARFLTAAACLADGPVVLDGAPRMRERPILEEVVALRALGAGVEVLGREGCPPLRLAGGGIPGGETEIDARRSSQYVSGILLVAPYAERDVTLRFKDGVLVSRSFVDLTLDVMSEFGAEAGFDGDALHVRAGQGYTGRSTAIEADSQAAVYGFVAAAIAGGRVEVTGVPGGSEQTDLGVLAVLERMGCRVERLPEAAIVTGPEDGLRGVDVDMNAIPDPVLAVAVAALFADGPTTIRGIGHLRIKETDRLAALKNELERLGARAHVDDDSLRIEPGPLRPADVETYDDHRMAMSFALAGLRIEGLRIRDPGCVAKTWPDFFQALDKL
ncbi:MAG: 3-phosphoshikimate 1-carboxyvinyltransferase [Myxococcota bacterium]|nr:3-phosphoshikimate 1-carboxyvinyltransferase [Myxococcota bacterium]